MTSTVPKVTVAERRALMKVGYPWGSWVLLERPAGSPVIRLTLGDLRILRKYGRDYEPVAILLWLARADARRLLAFLAAMRHRAVVALHLAALQAPQPAVRARSPDPDDRRARLLCSLRGSPARLRLTAHGGAVSAVVRRGEATASG